MTKRHDNLFVYDDDDDNDDDKYVVVDLYVVVGAVVSEHFTERFFVECSIASHARFPVVDRRLTLLSLGLTCLHT